MGKTRVLVVDDKIMIRDSIKALLGLYDDIEVVGEASEIREAIEKTQELAPDVVLIDIAFPDMAVLKTIPRMKKKNPEVKVLLVMDHYYRDQIVSGTKAGADGYLSKGASGSELISAIHALQRGEFYLYPSVLERAIADYRKLKKARPYDKLTPRQREVLKLIAEGYTSREIADILNTSCKTVQNHRVTMMKKLDIHNSTKLVRYAIRSRLVSLR